jgi:hypothetical protein
MIKKVTLYQVFCDGCGKLFDNEEPKLRMNETHLYTSLRRAEIGIQRAGWIVMHNHPNSNPRIYCKSCNEKFQKQGQTLIKIKELLQ